MAGESTEGKSEYQIPRNSILRGMVEILKPESMRNMTPPGLVDRMRGTQRLLVKSEAGAICERDLNLHKKVEPLPENVESLYDAKGKYAKQLWLKMTQNAGRPFPLLVGKPSSAYIILDGGGNYRVRFLVEALTFKRDDTNRLHYYMYQPYDDGKHAYDPSDLQRSRDLWSGHFAKITRSFRQNGYEWLFLADRIIEGQNGNPRDKNMVKRLRENNIIVVDGNGKLIHVDEDSPERL